MKSYFIDYFDNDNRHQVEYVLATSRDSAIRKLYLRHIGENITVCR